MLRESAGAKLEVADQSQVQVYEPKGLKGKICNMTKAQLDKLSNKLCDVKGKIPLGKPKEAIEGKLFGCCCCWCTSRLFSLKILF